MDTDPALDELKKLREGRGLNADRLSEMPNLLSSLGTSDPGEAFDALRAILDRMGDGERVRALKVDFAVELRDLLEREPASREYDYLGDRRSAYGEIIGRDTKTLARWSDRTIAELRGQLISDRFDGHIVIAAGVKDRRVNGVEVMRYDKTDEKFTSGKNTGYLNPEDSSLPLVLYGFPRDWRPINIRFAIAFLGDDHPQRVWALVADSVLDVGSGHERTELEIVDGIARCRIENPNRSQLYGVWWEW